MVTTPRLWPFMTRLHCVCFLCVFFVIVDGGEIGPHAACSMFQRRSIDFGQVIYQVSCRVAVYTVCRKETGERRRKNIQLGGGDGAGGAEGPIVAAAVVVIVDMSLTIRRTCTAD